MGGMAARQAARRQPGRWKVMEGSQSSRSEGRKELLSHLGSRHSRQIAKQTALKADLRAPGSCLGRLIHWSTLPPSALWL